MEELHYYRDENVVLYKRNRSKKWQDRIKIPNKWLRLSTKEADLKVASEIACEKYDEIRFKDRHNIPLDTRKFKSVAKIIDEIRE